MSNTFDYAAAVKSVVAHERKSARLESTYDGLVAFAGLNSDSESERITEVARAIVVDGARLDGTKVGESLTVEMLTGRDPGADAKHRDYWKAARAVRIGLVSAIKRAAGDAGDDESEDKPVNLLTRAGLKADLEDVIRAWKAAHENN